MYELWKLYSFLSIIKGDVLAQKIKVKMWIFVSLVLSQNNHSMYHIKINT